MTCNDCCFCIVYLFYLLFVSLFFLFFFFVINDLFERSFIGMPLQAKSFAKLS